MKIIKLKHLMQVPIVLFGCLFNSYFAFAENLSTTINVSPMAQKMILVPGETTEGSIKVSNPYEAKSDLKYIVSVGAFSQKEGDGSKDDYGVVDTESVGSYNQIIDWIKLSKTSGTVAPNTTDVVLFTIEVPGDAPAGGQYATIIVKEDNDNPQDGGNVSIQSKVQIASIIYAEVAGETREKGEILSNEIPSFLLNNTLEASSMVQNNGNVHTNASYILQVWPAFSSEEICTNEEKPSESLIMPETERFHVETCDLPSVGVFRVKQTVKIFGETSIVEKTIIVCPLWLLFIIIFAIIVAIMWLVMKARKRSKAGRNE